VQGNSGANEQKTLVGTCTKSSSNKSRSKVTILWTQQVKT